MSVPGKYGSMKENRYGCLNTEPELLWIRIFASACDTCVLIKQTSRICTPETASEKQKKNDEVDIDSKQAQSDYE